MGRRLRWTGATLGAVAAGLAVAAVAAWLWRTPLVERVLHAGLAWAGFPEARLTVAAVGPNRLRLEDVRLAPGLRARAVTVRYSAGGLWQGRLRPVSVHGLDATVRPTESGWRVPGLGALEGGGGGGAPPVRPAAVRCADCRVTLESGAGRVRIRAAGLWTPETTRFDARVRVRDGRLPGRLADARAAALVHGTWTDGRLRLRTSGPVTVAARALGPLAARLPDPHLDGRLTGPDGGGMRLTAAPEDGAWTVSGGLKATLTTGPARAAAGAAGEVSLWGDGVPRRLDLDYLRLAADDWPVPGVTDGRFRLVTGPVTGAPPVLATPVTLSARAQRLARDGVTVHRPQMAARGTLRLDGRQLAFRPATPVRLRAARLDAAGRLGMVAPSATLSAEGPLGRVATTADGRFTAAVGGRLSAEGLAGTVSAGEGGPLEWQAALPAVDLAGSWNGRRPAWSLEATDARLAVPGRDARAEGIDVTAGPDGWSADVARLTVAPLAPLRVTAQGPLSGREATAGVHPAAMPDRRLATLDAQRAGDGAVVDVRTPRLRLGPNGVPLDALVPAAEGRVEADGHSRAKGRVRLPSGTAALDVAADNLDVAVGPAVVEKVNGVVRLTDVLPPTTPQGQELVAAGVRGAGPPVSDVRAAFHLPGDGSLMLEHARAGLADGQLSVRDMRLAPGRLDGLHIPVVAEGVSLQALADMSPLENLTAKGRLTGTVPLTFREGRLRVESGMLANVATGRLRFRPEKPPAALRSAGETGTLVLQALENFRYDSLRLTLGGALGGTLDVGIHLKGANPDLYDGHPIDLNLNVDGPLGALVRRGVASYRIPEKIRKRLRRLRE